ncbi:MAG: protamine-2 (modular protein) [Aestuariivirga sp.]|nr:protamine-2 (modular protein) [Aestuariivirga sp.]
MDRRLFVTGLLGAAGAAGIAAVLPREALAAVPMGPKPNSILPDLSAPADGPYEPEDLDELGEQDELEEGFRLAHVRRRRRVRRWRNRCRWRRINGHWRRRCRREPYWVWFWFWI